MLTYEQTRFMEDEARQFGRRLVECAGQAGTASPGYGGPPDDGPLALNLTSSAVVFIVFIT